MRLPRIINEIFNRATSTTGLSKEEKTRFNHFTVFLSFGIPLMLFFSVLNILETNYWVAFFAIISAAGLSTGWLFIKFTEKGIIVYRINNILYMSLLIYLVIYGGESGSKILWNYTYPLIAFFIFGKREGTMWICAGTFIIGGLFFLVGDLIPIYPYSNEFKVRFMASYITVTGVTYWLEYLRESYSSQLEAQNKALSEEIIERKRMEKEREELMLQVQAANNAKSEFLANMSHEIRTPLNGVIGMTSMLLDTKLNEQQRHYGMTIKYSGEFLLTIINDILDVSKIEAGKLELHEKSFSLRELLDNTADISAKKIYSSDIDFFVWAAPEVPDNLIGDRDRLQQILLNLVSNGLKFTERGSVTVSAEIDTLDDSHCMLRFSVKDSGIGIAESDQDKLFQSFSQIDTSITREYSGTGLGLTICKQLSEKMGGAIGVSSTLGQGAEFWFTVRLALDIAAPPLKQPKLTSQQVVVLTHNAFLAKMITSQFASWDANTAPGNPVSLPLSSNEKELIRKAHWLIIDGNCLQQDNHALQLVTEAAARPSCNVVLLGDGKGPSRQFEELASKSYILSTPLKYHDLALLFLSDRSTRGTLTGASNHPYSLPPLVFSAMNVSILLAEDNPINREVLVAILEKIGITDVDSVENGLEVLPALAAKKYNLVLMDLSMPKMDGLTVTKEIRRIEQADDSSPLPIIALTAHAIVGDKEKCLAAGMNDYLTKPVQPEPLVNALNSWLGPKDNATHNSRHQVTQKNSSADKSSNPPAQLNYQAMLDRMMGDEPLAHEVMELFLEDTPKLIEKLTSELHALDRQKAHATAHLLKGTAANLSCERFSLLCQEIEEQASSAPPETLARLIHTLWTEYEGVKETMESHLAR